MSWCFLASYREKFVSFSFMRDECSFTLVVRIISNRRIQLKLFGAFLRKPFVQVFGLDVEQAGTMEGTLECQTD